MTPSSHRFRSLLVVLALAWSELVCAAAGPWPEAPFRYFARQASLTRVMSDFSRTFGIALNLSVDVQGDVSGDLYARTPTEFLDSLAKRYGFNWYYQEGVLYVTPARAWTTQVLHVGMTAADVSALRVQLMGLGVYEPRFGWAEFPGRGIVIVSGPDSYVEKISSIVGSLGTGPSDGRQLRVFSLRYARAEDYTFRYQDQQVTTPGVATLLRNLAAGTMFDQGRNPGSGSLSVAPPTIVPPLPSVPAIPAEGGGDESAVPWGLDGVMTPVVNLAAGSPRAVAAGAAAGSGATISVREGTGALSPVIESDPRQNAVIIYDAPEKMPIYEALIRQLDAFQPQIQIEAMILDIDTEAVDTLGVAWQAGGGSARIGFGDSTAGQATILSVDTGAFFARVNALATKGRARVLGRPTVLTLDNLVAVMSLSETIYARVGGLRGDRGGAVGYGALVPISTGTLLRVIPRLVDEGDQRSVALIVEIQDGQFKDGRQSRGDWLPTVTQSGINTQALIGENDCLLIGGYFMERDHDEENRVPGLSGVPLVGGLFRDKRTQHSRSERLFLIRPRVVTTPSAALNAPQP